MHLSADLGAPLLVWAIGGLLTPALATGATLGVCTGRLWTLWWPGVPVALAETTACSSIRA